MAWQAGLRTGDFLIEVGTRVRLLLPGESAGSLGVGSVVLAAWPVSQAGGPCGGCLGRGLPRLFPPMVDVISCGHHVGIVFEALALSLWRLAVSATWLLILK